MLPVTSILQLKTMISKEFNIAINKQRLMFKGKTLQGRQFNLIRSLLFLSKNSSSHFISILDAKSLEDYQIVEGAKIHLFKINSNETESANFWVDLKQFLRQHFEGEDVQKIIEYMKNDICNTVDNLSLDDIERMAQKRLSIV